MKTTRFAYPAASLASCEMAAAQDLPLCVMLGGRVAGPEGCGRPQVPRAVRVWERTLAVAWVVVAASRIEQTMSVRVAVVGLSGLASLATVLRVIFPGRGCNATPAAFPGVA